MTAQDDTGETMALYLTRRIDAALAELDAMSDAIIAKAQADGLCFQCRRDAPRSTQTARCERCYTEDSKP